MEILDYDHTIHTTNKGDEALLVKFYMDILQDTEASKGAGRPIFKEAEWIDIRIPGNKDNVVIRPVRANDKTRFPRHYQLFQNRIAGSKEEMVGTPLTLWPVVTVAQIKEFEYFNIRTVEQLAAIPDSAASKFGGIHQLKQKAEEYLSMAAKKAPLAKMRGQIEEMQETIARLEATNKVLAEKLNKEG
jgi:hypothetical protein